MAPSEPAEPFGAPFVSGPDDLPPPDRPSDYRLSRSTTDSMIGGVCGGLGEALGVDPVWFRLAFVILALGSGAGVLLYIVAWVIMPEQDSDAEARLRLPPAPGRGSMIAGLLLLAVGAALLIDALVPWFDRILWPMAVMVAGAGLLYAGSRR